MVRLAVIRCGDGACDEDVSTVSLSDGILQSVTLFGSRMPPGDLQNGRRQDDGICHEKLVISGYAEKAKPIVIAVPMALV